MHLIETSVAVLVSLLAFINNRLLSKNMSLDTFKIYHLYVVKYVILICD